MNERRQARIEMLRASRSKIKDQQWKLEYLLEFYEKTTGHRPNWWDVRWAQALRANRERIGDALFG